MGAISVIRISGGDALRIFEKVFSKSLEQVSGHTAHYGLICRKAGSPDAEVVDEVVATVYRAPRSFTGEDVVEVSCHGSTFVQSQVVQLLLEHGCRLAAPGEFSMRAFANGKVDLSQAEAIADLIASTTAGAHKLAMNQMRGGFSKKIAALREGLIHFASLIELELDFSEEDVEFADRQALRQMLTDILAQVRGLADSFASGQAIKNGIPVAIMGAPNMGKSTLLNALLNEERAIVSDIAGTTRDLIEDELVIEGVRFRFIDTAGLRHTADVVERMGIDKALQRAMRSEVVLYLSDARTASSESLKAELQALRSDVGDGPLIIPVLNKADIVPAGSRTAAQDVDGVLLISAATGEGLNLLRARLLAAAAPLTHPGTDVVVSNLRHFEALSRAGEALQTALNGLDQQVTADFLAMDIRRSLFHLGEITGQITTDDLLENIFSKFCIGK
jgi:tRNA modification GTPase